MSEPHQKGYMPWDRSGNRLLVKSQLGKNKPTNYDVPAQNFVYGKLTGQDPQHANQVMYKWKHHQPTSNQNHLKNKDLIQTNKYALKKNCYTHHLTKTLYKSALEGTNVVKIRLPEDNHAYGKPLDLQDPVKLVIANNYGEQDKFARHTFYNQQTNNQEPLLRRLSCHITKNHNLLKEATAKRLQKFNWIKKPQLWKMSKFTDINFKVQTRRPRAISVK